jgi:hypothetical protein
VLARIIEPSSKLDADRVPEEAGEAPASYPTVNRRLPAYGADSWRQQLSAAWARHAGLGRASLVLYDVSTLYFDIDAGDGFRESGFSKTTRTQRQPKRSGKLLPTRNTVGETGSRQDSCVDHGPHPDHPLFRAW